MYTSWILPRVPGGPTHLYTRNIFSKCVNSVYCTRGRSNPKIQHPCRLCIRRVERKILFEPNVWTKFAYNSVFFKFRNFIFFPKLWNLQYNLQGKYLCIWLGLFSFVFGLFFGAHTHTRSTLVLIGLWMCFHRCDKRKWIITNCSYCTEQVSLGINRNKSLQCWPGPRRSCRGVGRVR